MNRVIRRLDKPARIAAFRAWEDHADDPSDGVWLAMLGEFGLEVEDMIDASPEPGARSAPGLGAHPPATHHT